jgi:KUP system potassium uptake protein
MNTTDMESNWEEIDGKVSVKRETREKDQSCRMDRRHLAALSLAALGVVFGDIGTSPLYAVRECFYGDYGIAVTSANVMGVLSLMFWALILIVTIKYVYFIMNADYNGEGGVFALAALVHPKDPSHKRRGWILVAMGLFGAALLYGDGMITPAISVLSAVEGIKIVTPLLTPYVIPVTIMILTGLFLLQRRGTAKVGALFGPIIMVWFIAISVIGFRQIISNPKILVAMLPWYGIDFLLKNRIHGFLVLGAVFLVATGAEALYADLGHFGARPIRLVWTFLVLPALLLNYFGQGALLLFRPEKAHHPFYAMVPTWAVIPMVLLATIATIIASQAVVTGAYSLTRQVIQLGYFPRLRIVHTSAKQMGQIYIPMVNWLLMICTIGLVLGFQASSKLAAAYGVAVTSTMLISTILINVVSRKVWKWSVFVAAVPTVIFFVVDCAFFSANLAKIFHGAWFPLVVAGAIYFVMMTWKRGRDILWKRIKDSMVSFKELQRRLSENNYSKINGQAIYLTGNPDVVPAPLMHNLTHHKALHSEIAFLHFQTEEIPRMPNERKVEVRKLGSGFYAIIAHYGFMEEPHIGNILSLARGKGLEFRTDQASIFIGRERLEITKKSGMDPWRSKIFGFLSHNSFDAAAYFNVPGDRLIEIGVQVAL